MPSKFPSVPQPAVSSRTQAVLPSRAQVAVVGGGVIGLAVAEELGRRGVEVLVLERDDGSTSAAHASAGMVAPAAEADVELPGLVDFRKMSADLYPGFVARLEKDSGLDCGFRREPTLLVSLDVDHEAELERLHVMMTEQGFEVQRIGADAALEIEPGLSSRVTGGLLLPQDSRLDPRRLLHVLRVALAARGGRLAHGVRVQGIAADGTVHGRCMQDGTESRFEIACERVVLAAGSWSNVDIESPCVPLPLRPLKGQLLRLEGEPLISRVLRTPHVYIVPREAGEIVVGATVEEQGFDAAPTAGAVLDLLRHAWRALPGIYDLHLVEIAVGFRPTTRDHLPVVGRCGTSAVYVSTGHYRNGILLAPGTAKLMGDLICEERADPLLRFFGPARFQTGPARVSGGSAAAGGRSS